MIAPEEREQIRLAASEPLTDDHEFIKSLGGGDFLRRQLQEHRERRQRLEAMLPELTEKYPDQWAALTEKGELLIVPTLAELRAKFEELNTRPGSNAIEFLDTEPLPWIL